MNRDGLAKMAGYYAEVAAALSAVLGYRAARRPAAPQGRLTATRQADRNTAG